MPQDLVQNYRGLKAAVIIMGVLLILGTIALVVGLVRQTGQINQNLTQESPQNIVLPPELSGKITQFQVDGGRVMLLTEQMGRQRLILLDLASGKILMHVDASPGTP